MWTLLLFCSKQTGPLTSADKLTTCHLKQTTGSDAKKFRFVFLKASKVCRVFSDPDFRRSSWEVNLLASCLNQKGKCTLGKGQQEGWSWKGQGRGWRGRLSSWKGNEHWAAENRKFSSSIFHLPLNSLQNSSTNSPAHDESPFSYQL